MKKFENFCNALEKLKEVYDYQEPYSNVIMTGLVSLYSICFEQSWKAMKEILEIHGYEESATGSPKFIIRTAYKAGLIDDEETWLSALQSRNNVSHSYNKEMANDITKKTKQKYVTMFSDLKEKMEKNWI